MLFSMLAQGGWVEMDVEDTFLSDTGQFQQHSWGCHYFKIGCPAKCHPLAIDFGHKWSSLNAFDHAGTRWLG